MDKTQKTRCQTQYRQSSKVWKFLKAHFRFVDILESLSREHKQQTVMPVETTLTQTQDFGQTQQHITIGPVGKCETRLQHTRSYSILRKIEYSHWTAFL